MITGPVKRRYCAKSPVPLLDIEKVAISAIGEAEGSRQVHRDLPPG